MDTNLREQFDRAVGDDPGADPGVMAHAAIVRGARMRRRRRQAVAAGVAAGVAAVLAAVSLPSSEEPQVTVAAMMPVAAPSCTVKPVETDATDALVFLDSGMTGGQRSALESALAGDPRVATLLFESREQAYERFRSRWADNPDLLAAVSADQFPESFRLRLVDASQYAGLRADYMAMDGVDTILGRACAADAPVGGVL